MKLIAELCQNHCGDREVLSKMIWSASCNGADYVKIQTIFADELTLRPEFEIDGIPSVNSRLFSDEARRLSKLELTIDDHKWFIDECVKHNVIPLSTPFTYYGAKILGELEWPERIVKIASYDCCSLPFIKVLLSFFDKLIISTGATYDEEVHFLMAFLANEIDLKELTLLHCVTKYPTLPEDARLLRISWLRQFHNSVGFSDHSSREYPLLISKCAIYLGASVVERHFTILDHQATKDGPVSVTPAELLELKNFSLLSPREQLSSLQYDYSHELLGKVFTYSSGMSTFEEVKARNYYRGRFATKAIDGSYQYNWLPKE